MNHPHLATDFIFTNTQHTTQHFHVGSDLVLNVGDTLECRMVGAGGLVKEVRLYIFGIEPDVIVVKSLSPAERFFTITRKIGKGGDPVLTVYREEDTALIGYLQGPFTRKLSGIVREENSLNGFSDTVIEYGRERTGSILMAA